MVLKEAIVYKRRVYRSAHPRYEQYSKTKNKFVETVALAECYLITNHVKNKDPFRICLSVKLADGRMSIKWKKILCT